MKLKISIAIAIFIAVLVGLGIYFAPEIGRHRAQQQLTSRGLELPDRTAGLDPEWAQKVRDSQFVEIVCSGRGEDARLFLAAGYAATTKSLQDELTPLHCAALTGDVALARDLIERGADVTAKTRDAALQPIHFAALVRRVDLMRLLLESGAAIDAPSRAGPPVMLAVTLERRRWIPRSARQHRDSPDSVRPANSELLTELLALGADLDARNYKGESLLHLAVDLGDPQLLQALLAHGLDVDARDAEGRTPLVYSALRLGSRTGPAQTGIMLALIERGAKVNARDNRGASAFCPALGHPRSLKVLLERGLDPNVARSDGTSCWYGLRQSMTPDEVRQLAEQIPGLGTPVRPDGSPGAGPLYAFAHGNDPELVRYFLARGLEPNDRGAVGYGVLHAALMTTGGAGDHEATRLAIVRMLLDAGAEINLRADHGVTPIMLATRQPAATIQLLIQRGANVNAVDTRTGRSVLDIFERAKAVESITLLRAAGASSAASFAGGSTNATTR